MNTEAISKWTQELRSGNRAQGTGKLEIIDEDGVKRQCCLGVACELFADELGVTVVRDSYGAVYDGSEYVLPTTVSDYLDFPSNTAGESDPNPDIVLPLNEEQWDQAEQDGKMTALTIAELNDAGFTFAQLADVIDFFFRD